jgi:hypothetical protein
MMFPFFMPHIELLTFLLHLNIFAIIGIECYYIFFTNTSKLVKTLKIVLILKIFSAIKLRYCVKNLVTFDAQLPLMFTFDQSKC